MFKLTKTQGIGIFVVAVLIAFYLILNFLRGQDIFNSRNRFYALFENVEGLSTTGPVYLKGLKIGMIENITYNQEEENFTVEFTAKSEFNIPSNSSVEIYSSDILGGKALRVKMGNGTQYAKNGDTLAGNIVPDMIASLTNEIGPMKEQLSTIMTNLNGLLVNINTILDTNGRENISQTLENLNSTLKNTEGITANLNTLSPEIKSIVENLDKLASSLGEQSGALGSSLQNIESITKDLSEADLRATIETLRTLAEQLQNPEGSIGKLMHTDSLHNSLDSLVRNINAFVDKVSENPKKFIKISVF